MARGWLATVAIAVVMLGIIGVGWALARAPAPTGPIEVGLGVKLTPPQGWRIGGQSTSANTVLLSRGDASLGITASSGDDELAAVARQRDDWLAHEKVTVAEIAPVDLRPGQSAARFAYSGTFEQINSPVEGSLTGVRGTGIVVLFDGWAGFGGYAAVASEIDAIIRSAVIP